MIAALFTAAVTIVILGWLWFYVVRPILEDFGVIHSGEPVKRSPVIMSRPLRPAIADNQTDRADRPSVSADHPLIARLRLDKTKAAIIEVLVYSEWQTGEIRAVLKGDNGTIGIEVEAARKRLGIEPSDRTLTIRDKSGERVITY